MRGSHARPTFVLTRLRLGQGQVLIQPVSRLIIAGSKSGSFTLLFHVHADLHGLYGGSRRLVCIILAYWTVVDPCVAQPIKRTGDFSARLQLCQVGELTRLVVDGC